MTFTDFNNGGSRDMSWSDVGNVQKNYPARWTSREIGIGIESFGIPGREVMVVH